MKQGRTLQELAIEIERQKNVKKDFIADTSAVFMDLDADKNVSLSLGENSFIPTENCHSQISSRLQIPKKYYDKMKDESPELLINNVNHWFKKSPEKRMIRTLDNDVRAFLSSTYRTLDNYDLLQTALPILSEKQCDIASCQVTNDKLYLKVLFPKVEAEIKKGDIVQAGIVVSNSEVGLGSVCVQPFIYRLVCTNGLICDSSIRKYHVGKDNEIDGDIQELLSDRTKQMTDVAFWMKVQDIIKSSFSRDIFEGNVQKLREAADIKIESKDLPKVVEAVRNSFSLNISHGQSILQHLCAGGDFSKWGLANAVTRTANDEHSYESATLLEKTGGKIIQLNQKDWRKISEAV